MKNGGDRGDGDRFLKDCGELFTKVKGGGEDKAGDKILCSSFPLSPHEKCVTVTGVGDLPLSV